MIIYSRLGSPLQSEYTFNNLEIWSLDFLARLNEPASIFFLPFLEEGDVPIGVLDDNLYGFSPSNLVLSTAFKDRFLVIGSFTSSAKDTRLSFVFILRRLVDEWSWSPVFFFFRVSDYWRWVKRLCKVVDGVDDLMFALEGVSLVVPDFCGGDLLAYLVVSGVLCLVLIIS